ncbi:MAG: glucokinase [Rhodobacteraceae bacterium]|nr:glucokinase [Paracoccaceae bacterium]
MSDLVLVGDTGGTNTRFALADAASGQLHHIRQFRNAAHASYEAAVSAYLDEVGQPSVAASALAFAAPITDATVRLTNHDWTITKAAIQARTGGRAPLFLNDLEALAWSLDLLPQGGIEPVGPSEATAPEGGRLVIGIGTGFNAAVLEGGLGENRRAPVVRVAECGHMTLPIETAEELSLRDHLARGRGRASVERALSGLGLVEVHDWACAHLGQPAAPLSGEDITRRGLQGSDPACLLTCEMLVRFAARIAGDLALAYLPYGGIYLAGSVTQALRPLIQSARFSDMFTAKGRQRDLLAGFPLHILTNGTAALHGCAALALSQQPTA